jgi:hypothetical protein
MIKIICPNKTLPEWKRLVADIGEAPAYLSFFRNANVIPDPATARAILGMKVAATLTPKHTLSKYKKPKVPAPKDAIPFHGMVLPKIKMESISKLAGRTRQRSKVLADA